MEHVREESFVVPSGHTSSVVSISTTSAQSVALGSGTGSGVVLVTPSVDCYVIQGANPTALSDGTDLKLLGNNTYRCRVTFGSKLAFITATGTGSVNLTPEF